MEKEKTKKEPLKKDLSLKESKQYINITLLVIIIAMAVYSVINNFKKLKIYFDFKANPESLLVLAGVVLLTVLGIKQFKKTDVDSKVTGALLFAIIFFMSFGGFLPW